MSRKIIFLSGIGILYLFLFFGMFKAFQNDSIYHHTLGTISQNYERTGGWNDYTISKVSKPFLNITNENYLQWDASIYSCISQRMYSIEKQCYGNVRAAFFPLFPLLWKTTHASPVTISILNYLMFILSLALLVLYLLPNNNYLRISTFIALISLPTIIIYIIPYSESLFLVCTTIAVLGILKNKYSIYFIGILLMSMVRPATAFVWLAIVATEILIFLKNRKTYPVLRHVFSKSLPFLTGYIIVLIIQYASSGSWSAYIDAQRHWMGEIQGIEKITDWSIEGFGMNTFSVFFIAIPALAFLSYLSFNFKSKKLGLFRIDRTEKRNYLLLISAFYLTGIFVFTLMTSGGNLHSFFRFTICSPFFYIAILILVAYLSEHKSKIGLVLFSVPLLLLSFFLYRFDYGGERLDFSFFGLFMLLITFFYLLNRQSLSNRTDAIALLGIVLLNTVWNTYMLNAYFSNGWIFT